jgi:apolipoprotein N-acyltransferase
MPESSVKSPNPDLPGTHAGGRASHWRSYAPLFFALALLPFANGAWSVPAAAFLAPLFLLRFTRTHRPFVGLVIAFVVGWLAFLVQFRGMVPVPPLFFLAIGVFYGAASTAPYVADRLIAPRLAGWSATLVFPAAWAGVEYLVSFSPYGSWGASGYALYGNLPLLQLLSVTGLWGLAFLIGWFATAGNRVWELGTHSPLALRTAVVTAAVVGSVAFLGGARLVLAPPASPTVRIASLSRLHLAPDLDRKVVARLLAHQPVTAEERDTLRSRATRISDDLLKRADTEAEAGARLVFWGEANAPLFIQDQADLIQRGGELARRRQIYLGMALAGLHLDSTPPLENKLVLIGPDGKVAWEYLKARPVPGGEAAMSIAGDGMLRRLDTPLGRLSAVICFDADFPGLLAQAGTLQSDIVLDPANDWRAIDPWHTQMASFRAIEQGFNLVRQTSGGLSAAFDYQGRRLAAMDDYVANEHAMVSQVPTRGVRTLYSRIGDVFAWAALAGVAFLALLAVRRR